MKTTLWFLRVIIMFGMVMMLLPAVVRLFNDQPLLPGAASYGHARLAQVIAEQGMPSHDPAMPERAYHAQVFDLLLAPFIHFLGPMLAGVLLPFLLGMGTLGCAVLALRRWKFSSNTMLSILCVFVLSPLFVDVFAQATPHALELLLMTVLLVLLAPGAGRWSRISAALVAGLLATFGLGSALVVLIIVCIVYALRRLSSQQFLALVSIVLFMIMARTLPQALHADAPTFAASVPVLQAISDFSGTGLSLFAWLLAVIGLLRLWHFKKQYYAAMVLITLLLLAALFFPDAIVSGHILVSILAGTSVAFFVTRRWSFDDLRVLTILVLVCGLLFSTLTHALAIAEDPPTAASQEAAFAMRTMLSSNATVLALPSDGFWIAALAGTPVFMDGWLAQTPSVNERWAAAQAVWHGQDIERVRSVLSENSIHAIVITDAMRAGDVWDAPEQDLLFLLRNNETFKNVYRSSSVEVWAVFP